MAKQKQNNKRVIRRDDDQRFVKVPLSILHDKNLTANGLRVLVSMLSDRDDFNIYHKTLLGRIKMAENTLRAALKNIEEAGYLRRQEMKPQGHFYIISEYGKLNNGNNNQQDTLVPETEPTTRNW